jgi:hypothetical protein
MSWSPKVTAVYKTVKPEKLMSGEEHDHLCENPGQLDSLPMDKLIAFCSTAKWLAWERQSLTSLEGIYIGNKRAEELDEELGL